MNVSIQERLFNRLDQAPESKAIAYYEPAKPVEWFTYSQLFKQSSLVAANLAENGLKPGEVCVIVLQSDHLAVRAVMAVLISGGIPLLVAPPSVQGSLLDLPKILKHTARKANARIVLCADTMLPFREELESELEGMALLFGEDEIVGSVENAEMPRVFPASDAVGAMQLTSGTTGFPRVCVWSQEGILAALDGMGAAMGITSDDICFNWTPLYHDMGLINNFMLCITANIPLVLFSPHEFVKRPAMWLRGLQETGATHTWSPNFGFAITAQRARDRQLEGLSLNHVKGLWNAAERIHYDTIEAFYNRFKEYGLSYSALKTNFGCAENIGGATFTALDSPFVVEYIDAESLYSDWVARVVPEGSEGAVPIVGCGRAHPTLSLEILTEEGEPLEDGLVGRVALRSPSRLLHYKDDPESTAFAIQGDLLLTGDLGYKRNGELFWVGREKERITIRGKKYDPSDFEPVLFDIAGLRKGCFVVFGVEDDVQGTQRVILVSEVREPVDRPLEEISEDISKQTFLRLGVTISDIELVNQGTLAKTSSGKRRHRYFKQMYVDGRLSDYRYIEPTVEADAS